MDSPILIFGTGASSCKAEDGLRSVVAKALECGVRAFDTAPSYGTEKILGNVLHRCMKEQSLSRDNLHVQTKIDAWQMQAGNVEGFVRKTLTDMGFDYLDCLLIHWPVPEYFDATWKDLASLRDQGLVRRIGVCNVRLRHLERYRKSLSPQPDVIQIERHPLMTFPDEIAFCHDAGYEVQAYSALCKMDCRIRDSLVVKGIGDRHGKSVGQVVLRWHLDTGVSPIFTSKRPSRVGEYSDIFDFALTLDEIEAISALNEGYKLYLESYACPGL